MGEQHRAAVLSHFAAVNDHCQLKEEATVVISDIDDTVVSTFKDWRFPFDTLYPGCKQFYHELIMSKSRRRPAAHSVSSTCSTNSLSRQQFWQDARQNVVFVSARPPCLDRFTYDALNKQGFGNSLALTGETTALLSFRKMMERKVVHCTRLQSLFKECSFILIGDNGQADIDLGKLS